MEDLNLYLKDVLSERPHTRVPSADTVLRGIEELATETISYTAEKTGNVYDFNTAEKLNQLLVKLLLATGQLGIAVGRHLSHSSRHTQVPVPATTTVGSVSQLC